MAKDKTQKQMIQEMHQGMYGIDGTDDKGMFGTVKEMAKDLHKQNSRISRVEIKQKLIYVLVLGSALTGGAIGTAIANVVGS